MLYSPSKGRNQESAVVPGAAAVHPACLVAFSGQVEGRAIAVRAKARYLPPTDICSQSFHGCSTILDAQHLQSLLSSHLFPVFPGCEKGIQKLR
jgi:hypothetical protein